jgi:hypothetical protein
MYNHIIIYNEIFCNQKLIMAKWHFLQLENKLTKMHIYGIYDSQIFYTTNRIHSVAFFTNSLPLKLNSSVIGKLYNKSWEKCDSQLDV